MNRIESAPYRNTNVLRRLAQTRTGKLAVGATAAVGVLAGCSYQGVHGNTNTTPSGSAVMDVFDNHLVLCMKESADSSGDQIIYDCDWRDYNSGTTPQEPRSTPRVNLTESEESFGSGKLQCLDFTIAEHHIGKTCDWSDPSLVGKVPGYPIQAVGYGNRDALCLSEKARQDYQYSCNLDEPAGYNAPYNLTYITDGTFVEHDKVPFDGTTVNEYVYNLGEGDVGAAVDWATFHPKS